MQSLRISGARAHNLRDISLELPLEGLTVVTGVSGSGKSSLVFDTIHAEARRRYVEALGMSGAGLRRPAVDRIDGLPPTVALQQHERAPGPLETLGSLSGIESLLSVVWARGGVQHDPETGDEIRPTPHDRIIHELLAGPPGARLLIEAPLLPAPDSSAASLLDEVRRAGFSRVRIRGEVVRIDDVPASAPLDPEIRVVVDRLKLSAERRPRLAEALRLAGRAGRGVIVAHFESRELVYVDRPFSLSTGRTFPDLAPSCFSWRGSGRCPVCEGRGELQAEICSSCEGARLREASRHVRFRGRSFPEAQRATMAEVLALIEAPDPDPAVEVALVDLRGRLRQLIELGMGELPLERRASTLSGSELRRLRLARSVAQELSGVLYLLDEPTAGLHPELVPAVIALIDGMIARGNAVVAVSHREALVRHADRILELGPGAGEGGGVLVFLGPVEELATLESPTGRWLAGLLGAPELAPAGPQEPIMPALLVPSGTLLPLPVIVGGLTAVTGPPGAGSSRLVTALERAVSERQVDMPGIDRVLRVEPVRVGSARSLVATFVGLWDVLRELLASTTEASIRGLTASHFSLATPGGRCEGCKGVGEVKIDLGLLPPVWLPCEICDGRRFQEDVLDIRWKGRSAADLLELPVSEAHRLLAGHPRLERPLRALVEVGLGYLPLGQPTRDLSGGEGARLRLARELARTAQGVQGALLLLDGPTDGLHPADSLEVIELLSRLSRSGAAVVVASHDPVLHRAADRVLSLPG